MATIKAAAEPPFGKLGAGYALQRGLPVNRTVFGGENMYKKILLTRDFGEGNYRTQRGATSPLPSPRWGFGHRGVHCRLQAGNKWIEVGGGGEYVGRRRTVWIGVEKRRSTCEF
jgi:hypothetical protein